MNTDEVCIAKAKVISICKEQIRTDSIIQGVKKSKQSSILKNPRIRGGNGTYLEIGEYLGTVLNITVEVYNPPFLDNQGKYQVPNKITLQCYESVKNAFGRKAFGQPALFDSDLSVLIKTLKGKDFSIILKMYPESPMDGCRRTLVMLCAKINDAMPFYDDIIIEPLNK